MTPPVSRQHPSFRQPVSRFIDSKRVHTRVMGVGFAVPTAPSSCVREYLPLLQGLGAPILERRRSVSITRCRGQDLGKIDR